MYARSTTVRGNPQALDQGIAYVHDEVLPMLWQLDGCLGLSLLCDRDSGRCILTTSWTTDDAMHAGAEAVGALRDHACQLIGDPSPDVQDWEIAVMHRTHATHDGCRTRVIWARADVGRLPGHLQHFRTGVLPKLEAMPGFCSVSLLADKARGRTVTASTYDSRDDMNRNSEQARAVRDDFARSTGMEITGIAEFDLVLAHLRVPELV